MLSLVRFLLMPVCCPFLLELGRVEGSDGEEDLFQASVSRLSLQTLALFV